MRHSTSLLIVFAVLACLPTITAAQWYPGGVRITYAPGNELSTGMLPDNTGGAVIMWHSDSNTPEYQNHQRAQRVNGAGILKWQSDGVILLPGNGGYGFAANSNGTDGVFTAWYNNDLKLQWFNGAGVPQWPTGGVYLSHIYNYALTRIVTDQAGGAIVVWFDWRPGHENELYAQRVNASGTPLWPAEGIPLVVLTSGTWNALQDWHSIASDGAGGVVVAWHDYRTHFTGDIYAQRLSASGQRLWGDEGVLLCNPAGEQREPVLASDGAGGAFVAWNDLLTGNVHAQHVDATGAIQWGANGIPVHDQASEQVLRMVVSDGASGVFINWLDHRAGNNYDQYIQHYNAAGVEQWTPGGAKVIATICCHAVLSISPNAQGGALVGFTTGFEARVQRMSPSGARELGDQGALVATGSGIGSVPDGAGGLVIAWTDTEIFAQRVNADGQVTTAVNAPTPGAALRVGEIFPNPFSGTTTLDIELSEPALVRVDVFDVAGRRVRQMALPESITSQRMSFDGRDDSGKLLASGVYFCRVQARGESITRKIVITR